MDIWACVERKALCKTVSWLRPDIEFIEAKERTMRPLEFEDVEQYHMASPANEGDSYT